MAGFPGYRNTSRIVGDLLLLRLYAFHMAPSAKLNVAGAHLIFGGGEKNILHVVDEHDACTMLIIRAHV